MLAMQMLHKPNTAWNEDEKQLAIELHYRSPSLYQTLIVDKGFTLPSRRTISSWLSVMDLMPGISEDLLEKLKLKTKTMSDLERHVVVMFDEISIKKWLSFNEKRDIIEGFEDFGSFGRSPSVANHVLMFVVRGMFSKWRMPVAYFVSSGVTEGSMLIQIVNSVIAALLQIGLRVRGVVCDQGKNNAKAVSLLKVTKEDPFFSVENQKIFLMYDVPHLMKSIRNNLMTQDIHFDTGTASWKHVRDLYNFDVSSSKARSLCKLTNKHVAPNSFDKMKVSLATQIFSNAVRAAMLTAVDTRQLPLEAAETARFCGELNDIFDCLNSRLKVDSNPLKSAMSNETDQGKDVIKKLKSALSWIQSWKKIVPKKTNDKSTTATRTTRPPSFLGFEHTINAILQLWQDLSKDKEISYLLTNRLTQHAIEHEFSICRHKGGFVRNPSALQFRQNLRHRMQVALMVPPSSSNCELDVVEEIPTASLTKDTDVEDITDTEEEDDAVSHSPSYLQSEEDIAVEDLDEDKSDCDDPMTIDFENTPNEEVGKDDRETTQSTLESCSVQYVAGYLATVCQSKYKCQSCQDELTVDAVLGNDNELKILKTILWMSRDMKTPGMKTQKLKNLSNV